MKECTNKDKTIGRKGVVLSIVTIFALCLMPGIGWGAAISVNDQSAQPGDTVNVQIMFQAQGDLVSAVSFAMQYDSSRLVLSQATVGSSGTNASKQLVRNAVATGIEKILLYGLNANVLSDGVVIDIAFSVRTSASEGGAPIDFTDLVAASPSAGTVSITANSAVITVDDTAPVITITSPHDGTHFGISPITVEGSVDDPTIFEVLLNGNFVSVTSGFFSTEFTLSEGDTVIRITATDNHGNVGSATVTVSYYLGDANEDGMIDSRDVDVIRDQILGLLAPTAPADVNNDNMVNILDLQRVVNKL